MILGITAEEDEDENDKENLTRRREMMRNRLEKDFMFEEDDARYRRGGDIVSRWRDKRPTSPVQYRVGQNTVSALINFIANVNVTRSIAVIDWASGLKAN